MSNQGLTQFLEAQQDKFLALDNANGQLLNFKQECLFAKQQLQKNDFTLNVAKKNNSSLANSIQNVAAIGISLNPAMAHAYLVPRDGSICLDISYKGLIKLATDTGSILWAKADLVYKNDKFIYKGPAKEPDHEAEIFGDRGDIVGGYCIAKTTEGDHLIEAMPIDEINKIRNTSKAFTSGKKCPWLDWFEEMAKKTLIKRASKTWPHTTKRSRLDSAISVINEHEGLKDLFTQEQQDYFMDCLDDRKALELFFFAKKHKEDGILDDLFNAFPSGKKTHYKQLYRDLSGEAWDVIKSYAESIKEHVLNNDLTGLSEAIEELTDDEYHATVPMLDNETFQAADAIKNGTT